MARMLSQVATIIRGSVGGLTFSANQFYQIIVRPRTAPVQPNTTAQQLVRNALTAANGTWNGLTTVVRQQWDSYALNLSWPNPLGTHKVPGRQVFVAGRSLQNYVFDAGLAVPTFVTTAPPSFFGFYLPQNVVAGPPTGIGTGFGVGITPEANIDCTALIEIQGPFPDTVNRYKGPWDNAQTVAVVIPAATTTVTNFLVGADDDIYFVRVKMVADDAPPRISAQSILRVAVSTVP